MSKKAEVKKIDHYRVHPGEPGCRLVTPFKDGSPVIGELSADTSLAPPPSSLPAVSPKESEGAPLSKYHEMAHWQASLILAFEKEIDKRAGLKGEILNRLLKQFNSGSFLPDIREKVFLKKHGSVPVYKRLTVPTYYRWKGILEDQGVDGLVLKYGGAGSSKITDHEKNFLLALLLHQHCLKVGYTIKLLKDRFKKTGLESPSSPATLRRFADQFKRENNDLWVLSREGEKALDDKVLPYIERDRNLLNVGDGLVADGHRLNFQVIDPFSGKPCRASMVLFWDWRSAYPLGWEIMLEENTQCIATAFRNAVLNLGKIPKWVYLDNGKAFKARIFTSEVNLTDSEISGMFARLGINVHFAWPYNAKAKPIERFFGILSEQFERLMPSYTGASIEDKPAWTKRNEKLALSLHNDRVPVIHRTGQDDEFRDEIDEMMFKWREFYADQPSRGLGGKTPREIFEAGKGQGVDPGELMYLMMAREIRTVHRNGVTFLGRNWFNDALYGYRDRVTIKYSLSDLSQIYIFDSAGKFLGAAKPVGKANPMASESENPKDMEDVKRKIAHKRTLKNQTVKLYRLLGKKQEQLPWKEIVQEVPDVIEAIEKVEAEKPRPKFISPFLEIPDEESTSPDDNIGKVNPKTGLTCPALNEKYEIYEWYRKRDPEALNARDRDWIRKYEASEEWVEFYSQRGKIAIPCSGNQTEGDSCTAQEDQIKPHTSPLSCPNSFEAAWEMYEWYYKQDPGKLNIADLDWIDWHEEGYRGRHLIEESQQRGLRHILVEHAVRPNSEENDRENRKDYRLGKDPMIEDRWRELKKSLGIDPISGLSIPAEGLPPDDERTWYGLCRGIEQRFPGTLNDADWKKIEEYQATREWERIFKEYEIYRLYKPAIGQINKE